MFALEVVAAPTWSAVILSRRRGLTLLGASSEAAWPRRYSC
jgi:hypothetical protein